MPPTMCIHRDGDVFEVEATLIRDQDGKNPQWQPISGAAARIISGSRKGAGIGTWIGTALEGKLVAANAVAAAPLPPLTHAIRAAAGRPKTGTENEPVSPWDDVIAQQNTALAAELKNRRHPRAHGAQQ